MTDYCNKYEDFFLFKTYAVPHDRQWFNKSSSPSEPLGFFFITHKDIILIRLMYRSYYVVKKKIRLNYSFLIVKITQAKVQLC